MLSKQSIALISDNLPRSIESCCSWMLEKGLVAGILSLGSLKIVYQLKYSQKLPITLDVAWGFFSDPNNLRAITPDNLSFEMVTAKENKMYAGQMIAYRVRPLFNIPMEWVTEITHVYEPHYFIDEQRIGPYRLWHHEHHFKSVHDGVEMNDIITYQMPYGLLGKLLNRIKIKKDLDKIFAYRQAKIIEIFGH